MAKTEWIANELKKNESIGAFFVDKNHGITHSTATKIVKFVVLGHSFYNELMPHNF